MSRWSWLRWGGRLLGRVLDCLSWTPKRLAPKPADLWSEDLLRRAVKASPRANAYLSLEPGLHLFGSEEGLISWAGWRQTAFAVGGLHGPDAANTYAAFQRAAQDAGYRRVLAFPVAESERSTLADVGFRSLMVGSEAFVDPVAFSLKGGRRADLRQMVNRGIQRHGLVVEEASAELAAPRLRELYAGWLSSRSLGYPMRLLIGSPGLSAPEGRRYFQVRDPDGACRAFVSVTPGWSGQGYGLDVMARPPDAPSGAMETLICGVIHQLGAEGIRRFSLGACPMADRVPAPEDDHRVYRAFFRWLHASKLGNQLFAFRSLTHFKSKFDPQWEPVFLAAWPRVGFRALYTGCRMWGLFGAPPQVSGQRGGLPRPDGTR